MVTPGQTTAITFDAAALAAYAAEIAEIALAHGGTPYIKNPACLSAAAGILAVEACHAAEVRLQLLQAGAPFTTYVNQNSALRDAASAAADGVTPTDANSIAFARSFASVLNIVYLNTAATPQSGGFFPNGLNGRVTSLVATPRAARAEPALVVVRSQRGRTWRGSPPLPLGPKWSASSQAGV